MVGATTPRVSPNRRAIMVVRVRVPAFAFALVLADAVPFPFAFGGLGWGIIEGAVRWAGRGAISPEDVALG